MEERYSVVIRSPKAHIPIVRIIYYEGIDEPYVEIKKARSPLTETFPLSSLVLLLMKEGQKNQISYS